MLTQDPAKPPAINANPRNKKSLAFQTSPEPAYENASPCKRLLSIKLILSCFVRILLLLCFAQKRYFTQSFQM